MKKHGSWIFMILTVVVIMGGIIWYSYRPGQYDAFASCIADSGATFYGAFWCPYCNDQKAMFGRSANKLPYVECSTPNGQGQTQVCRDAGIESYPTWIFADDSVRRGMLSIDELAQATSCSALPDAER